MTEQYWIGLAAVIILGITAEWLAWRLHLPSILLLLLFGILAGPVTGFLDPDALFGGLLIHLVSISVAVILFEGGLSLNVADLREIGGVVRNLVTVGVAVTWGLSTLAAYSILRLDFSLAALFGAILVVTGPTVVTPLLRHVRPVGQVGAIIKWEGILNDPIGALLAVLVFEIILLGGFHEGAEQVLVRLLASGLLACLVGVLAAAGMVVLLKFYWIPDFLQNAFTLMMVVGAYAVSNLFQPESGFLAATVMGIALANQRFCPIKHIIEFKEDLRVLIISSLFILLAARLKTSDLTQIDIYSFLFLGILMFVARPAAVWLSSVGSQLSRQERLFLAGMAPRGIVAAAVSSVFAARLAETGFAQAERLVPLTFFVIIATVWIYGLSAFPVARRLQLAQPHPQGALIAGAHSWARELGLILKAEGFKVALVDSNWENITAARLAGLPTHFGGILSKRVLDEISFYGIGRLLALTSNDEANSLAAVHFSDVFGRQEVYQLSPGGGEQARKMVSLQHLSGRYLFGPTITHAFLTDKFARGATIKKTSLTEKFDYEAFQERQSQTAIPLFVITQDKILRVVTAEGTPKPRPGQTLISLIDSDEGIADSR